MQLLEEVYTSSEKGIKEELEKGFKIQEKIITSKIDNMENFTFGIDMNEYMKTNDSLCQMLMKIYMKDIFHQASNKAR